ncbi:hypothetical protein BRC71_10495 [Halobacteriales archaeon QH_7_65_31]|nr:MAG: hypothetical protein BRC71_10495 [Halobacteriales archaeon QH_7_65_31]
MAYRCSFVRWLGGFVAGEPDGCRRPSYDSGRGLLSIQPSATPGHDSDALRRFDPDLERQRRQLQRKNELTTNGAPIPEADVEDAFTYGEAKPSSETEMLFPTMRSIARSHG